MHTVLIIDDDPHFRSGFKELLELETYQTLEAENGLLGLNIMRQYLPDIVVCDLEMPVMNGFELLRTVKSDPQFAKIPFVMVSGRHDEQSLKSAYDLGVSAYLTKPLGITDFLSTIVYHLDT
jgi:CheY-like chemotaxis protein